MYKWLRNIRSSPLLINSSKIALGTVIAQIISLLTTPILTRLLGPDIYGEFGTFTAIYSLVGGAVFLGLSSAIIIAADDHEAQLLFLLCYKLLIGFTLGFVLVLFITSPFYRINIGVADYYIMIILLSATLFSSNLLNLNLVWLNRAKNYNLVFFVPIMTIIVNVITIFGFIYLNISELSLIAGTVIGQIVTNSVLLVITKPPMNITHKTHAFDLLKRYRDFPLYQLPNNFIKGFGSNVPILLMTTFFGTAFVGIFGVSQRLLYIPVSLIGAAVGQVHYKKCAELAEQGADIGEFTYNTLRLILLLIFIPFLLLNTWGEEFALFFLGDDWRLSGIVIEIRSFEFILTTLYFSISYILIVLRKQSVSLFFSIATLLINSAVVILSYLLELSENTMVMLLSVSNSSIYLLFFLAAFKFTKFGMLKILRLLITSVIAFFSFSFVLGLII